MTEKAERVAAKLLATHGLGLSRFEAKLAARAAIEAMREPTEVMARAGHDEFAVCEFGAPLARPCTTVPRDIYRAMIDAALIEGDKT